MEPNEAIEAIKSNYPPENYSILREALDLSMELLDKKEKGLLIELPVPIGSELWAITVDTNEINHDTLTYDVLGDFFDELDRHPEYKDRIFATKEEAEAKLKEWKEKK